MHLFGKVQKKSSNLLCQSPLKAEDHEGISERLLRWSVPEGVREEVREGLRERERE